MTTNLAQRLGPLLDGVLPVQVEDDGALSIEYDGTFASLRVVTITDDLELVSLTQMLAADIEVDQQTIATAADQSHKTMLGTVLLIENGERADVMLRYNFPGTGLADDALRTVLLMVLGSGADVRRALTA